MPSAIKLKKLTANAWTAENEAESSVPDPIEPTPKDDGKAPAKPKKKTSQPKVSLDITDIIDAKRKRFVPKEEEKLAEWLKENFEVDDDGRITAQKIYSLFTDFCAESNLNLPESQTFRRVLESVRKGKRYKIKDESAYKGLVNEKKKQPMSPEKKAQRLDSLKYKIKDIIKEALEEGGSPKKGLRFVAIKQIIMSKYPSLRLDLNPNYLKTSLERFTRDGVIELVKGIGMAGYYRLPGDYPESEDEKPKKKHKAAKESKEGEEKTDEVADENGESKDNKDSKESKENKETEDEEKSQDENGKSAEEGENKKEKEVKKKKRSKRSDKKKRRPKDASVFVSRHVEPKTLSDTFPLAMTFMTEPKDASAIKIRKYLEKYFPRNNLNEKLKATLERGCEKGLWQRLGGSYRLLLDDLNPNHTDTLEDQICLSILACHEPKQTSVKLLKDYIIEYHPNFGLDKHTHWFKKALEKEEKNGNIIRLTGIGSTGSFQLRDPFTPCPNWLAGEDEEFSYEDVEEEGRPLEEGYKARPTKSGRGRAAAAQGRQPDFVSYASESKVKKNPPKRKPKAVYAEESEDEDSEEEAPRKQSKASKKATRKLDNKKGQNKGKSNKSKPKSRGRKSQESDEEEEEEVSKPAKRTPKTKKSPASSKTKRSTSSRKRNRAEESEEEGEVPVTSPRRKGRKISYAEVDDSDEEPPKSGPSKRAKKSNKESSDEEEANTAKSSPRKRAKKPSYKDVSDDDDDDSEVEATKSSPRKRAKKPSYKDVSDDDDDDSEVEATKSSARKRAKKPSYKDVSDDDDDDAELEATKSSAHKRAKKPSHKDVSDDDDDDDDAEVEATKSTSNKRGGKPSLKDQGSKSSSRKPRGKSSDNDKSNSSNSRKRLYSDSDDSEYDTAEEVPSKKVVKSNKSAKKSRKGHR